MVLNQIGIMCEMESNIIIDIKFVNRKKISSSLRTMNNIFKKKAIVTRVDNGWTSIFNRQTTYTDSLITIKRAFGIKILKIIKANMTKKMWLSFVCVCVSVCVCVNPY
jgi:hypothetical protein